jgi:chromosome segregation ATPase
MGIRAKLQISSPTTTDRISELDELIFRQKHQIASVQTRLRMQNESLSERLTGQEQHIEFEIESVKTEICRLNQENDIIEREQTEIASRFNLLNKIKTRK